MFINSPAGFFQPPKLIQERFHRVEKAAGPVPSCSFERSFGLYRRCCLPGGRFGRRGVRAARRLRDFTWCDEFVRFLRSLQNKKFLEFQFHARRKKALPLSEARAPFASTTARDPPKLANKQKRRCPTTIARAPLIFLSRCSSTPSRRRFRYLDLTSRPKDGGSVCVCVCVWISVKISPFATTLSFFTPTSRLEEAFEKRTGSLFCVFERTFSSTDLHVQCVDFSFFFTEYKNPKTKGHFFGRHFYVPAQKRQTQSRHDLKRRQLSRVSSANIIRNEENKKR